MDNAIGIDNQNTGQIGANVGQDESVEQQETSTSNWEEQAKYFQSEKDKLQAENQRLSKYADIGRFLESRPDVVSKIADEQSGGQPMEQSKALQKPEEFDPWEAYNDPSSVSYKYRMQEMQQSVDKAVDKATAGIRKQTGQANIKSQLAARGFNLQEVDSFIRFTSKNPSQYGLDNVIKMWKAVSQPPAQSNAQNPLDKVRDVQSTPQVGGVLQGQRPLAPKSDDQAMWDSVLGADRGSKLP